jgi:phage tail sheath protein FI
MTYPHGVVVQQAQPTQLLALLADEKIGFIGCAPVHKAIVPSIGELKYTRSTVDVATWFGDRTNIDYDLPEFWETLTQYGVSEAFFINVFDPDIHAGTGITSATLDSTLLVDLGELVEYSAIVVSDAATTTPESQAWVDDTIDTTETMIANVIVTTEDGNTTYREGWDYTVLDGIITAIDGGGIDTANPALVGYTTADVTPLILDTDYTVTTTNVLDPNGSPYPSTYNFKNVIITLLTANDGDRLFISYTHSHPTFVTDNEIVGTVTGDGDASGLELFKRVRAEQGFDLTQVTATRTTSVEIAQALEALAKNLRCQAHINLTQFASVADAIAGRSESTGRVKNAFTVADEVILYSDWVKTIAIDGGEQIEPLCWHGIAIRHQTTRNYNFGRSISSRSLAGVLAPLKLRTLSRENIEADNQVLTEKGSYVTIFYEFASGYLLDGNYNASHPSVNDGSQFSCVRNARDTVLRSIVKFATANLDQPLTQVLALSIEGGVRTFIESLTNPNRATGVVLAQPTTGTTPKYATIDIPENDMTARAAGTLYLKLEIPYLTPLNTIILIETISITAIAA